MAEETATNSPTSMVVGPTEPGTNLMHPRVIPADTFHHRQGDFVGFTEKATNYCHADPFRRIHDSTDSPDVPVINHIGVFMKGDGEEEMHSKDQSGKLLLEFGSDQYQNGNLDSPVVPLPECGSKGHQVLVGGEREEKHHTPYDLSVSYSQECTEVRMGCGWKCMGKGLWDYFVEETMQLM